MLCLSNSQLQYKESYCCALSSTRKPTVVLCLRNSQPQQKKTYNCNKEKPITGDHSK